MMSKRWVTVVSVTVGVAVLAGGLAYNLSKRRSADERDAAPALAVLVPSPLSVTVTPFTGNGRALLGSAPLVGVSALGTQITEIQLFDNAALVGRKVFAPAVGPATSATFQWPALRKGRHVLHAVAVGATATDVAHSAPTRVEVVSGLQEVTEIAVPTNGLSVEEAAASVGIEPADATVVGDPTDADPAGAPLDVTDPTAPLPGGARLVVDVDQIASDPTSSPTTDVGITATLEGCVATITSPSAAPFAVYETGGSGPGFLQIGTVAQDAPLTTAELTPGAHVFVAGLVGGAATSAPVSVTAGADCLADVWSGDATLFDGLLTIPEPLPQVWAYVGVDGQPFERIPAVGTVDAPTGTADFGSVIPSLRGRNLRLEVWQPGPTPGAPAVMVARSEATLPSDERVAEIIGEPVVTQLFDAQYTLQPGFTGIDLDWDSSSRTDSVLWQVLSQPIGGDDRNTSPASLLATGISDANGPPPGSVVLDDRPRGHFTITADQLTPAADTEPSTLLAAPTVPALTDFEIGSSIAAAPFDLSAIISDDSAALVAPPGQQVWVRVIPLAGGAVIGPASNLSTVTLPDPDAVVPLKFTVDSVVFDPGISGNYQLATCVRVTQVPWDENGKHIPLTPTYQDSGLMSAFYKVPRTYCPQDFPPPECDGLCTFTETLVDGLSVVVDALAKVWDVVASAYNFLVELAVTIGAALNPFCIQARVATAVADSAFGTEMSDDVNSTCDAIAKVATKAVVSAVLSSFGLPPSLPTSAQLAEIAKGNLEVLAVEYLKSLGVPCDEMKLSPEEATLVADGVDAAGGELPASVQPSDGVDVCGQMIGAALEQVTKVVKTALYQQVGGSTGLPVPSTPIAGFELILEPRAKYTGADITITASTSADAPLNSVCKIGALGRAGERVTGGMQYKEQLELHLQTGVIRSNISSSLDFGWKGTLHLEGSELYEGNAVSISWFNGKCLAPLNPLPAQPIQPPLGYWYAGDPN